VVKVNGIRIVQGVPTAVGGMHISLASKLGPLKLYDPSKRVVVYAIPLLFLLQAGWAASCEIKKNVNAVSNMHFFMNVVFLVSCRNVMEKPAVLIHFIHPAALNWLITQSPLINRSNRLVEHACCKPGRKVNS
jgi:hypothetical protein